MTVKLPLIENLDVAGKRVLIRADLDVPIAKVKDGNSQEIELKVIDDARIREIIPTFKTILDKGCKTIVIFGHLGHEFHIARREIVQTPDSCLDVMIRSHERQQLVGKIFRQQDKIRRLFRSSLEGEPNLIFKIIPAVDWPEQILHSSDTNFHETFPL